VQGWRVWYAVGVVVVVAVVVMWCREQEARQVPKESHASSCAEGE
jgi:hypothetical protein